MAKIPEEVVEVIIKGNIEEVYNTFIVLEDEYEDYQTDYQNVRNGIGIKFDIYEVFKLEEDERKSQIYISYKNGKVEIYGEKQYEIADYRTELEERRKIMIKAILENTRNEEQVEPRT